MESDAPDCPQTGVLEYGAEYPQPSQRLFPFIVFDRKEWPLLPEDETANKYDTTGTQRDLSPITIFLHTRLRILPLLKKVAQILHRYHPDMYTLNSR